MTNLIHYRTADAYNKYNKCGELTSKYESMRADTVTCPECVELMVFATGRYHTWLAQQTKLLVDKIKEKEDDI